MSQGHTRRRLDCFSCIYFSKILVEKKVISVCNIVRMEFGNEKSPAQPCEAELGSDEQLYFFFAAIRWKSLISSTIGMIRTASPIAIEYSIRLMCWKPKALARKGM